MNYKNIIASLLCGLMVSSVLLTPVQAAKVNKNKNNLSNTSTELSNLDVVEFTDKENIYKYGVADNYIHWGDFKSKSDNSNDGISLLYEPQ